VLSTSFKSYGGAMLMLLIVMFSLRLMPSRTAFASTFEEKQPDAKVRKGLWVFKWMKGRSVERRCCGNL
jgi:hypothetical protein